MGKDLSKVSTTIYFCDGGSCRKAGSEQVVRAARAYLRNNGLWDQTHTIRTRCNGRCEDAPTCIIQSGNYWYKELSVDKIKNIIESHVFEAKPLEDNLLYMDEYETVRSEKERPKVVPKPFEEVDDALWGACWRTKGFSSDQYLYPLFLFLKNRENKSVLKLVNEQQYALSELQNVDYTHDYQLKLCFSEEEVIFIIGAVLKTASLEEQQAKITGTFYLINKQTGAKRLCFKNKLGQLIADLYLSEEDVVLWDYLVNIQLKGIDLPKTTMQHG